MNALAQTFPPIHPSPLPPASFRPRVWHFVIALVIILPVWTVVGVTGYFRLSPEARVLRGSLMDSVGGQWHKKFAVHLGGMTMGLVRFGSQFLHIPPEPKAALKTLHGAEVGIYDLADDPSGLDSVRIFNNADRAMKSRGWQRIVGVVKEGDLVAVYFPISAVRPSSMACCVMVFHERQLVVASARGNLEPLLDIIDKNIKRATAKFPKGFTL